MFNPDENPLPEIKKIEDILEPQNDSLPSDEEEYELEQKEIFSMGQKMNRRAFSHKLEEEQKPKKRGVGKRGPDKKKRVKKPLTEKQLAHLARMRVKAKEKRDKKREEKEKTQEETEEKTKTVSFVPPPMKEEKKVELKVESISNEKVYPRNAPKVVRQVTHPYPAKPQPPAPPAGPSFNQFFTMMEAYENHKSKKKKAKEKSIEQRLVESRQAKPHPNRRIPTLQRPVPPLNPYADMFRYKGGNW